MMAMRSSDKAQHIRINDTTNTNDMMTKKNRSCQC